MTKQSQNNIPTDGTPALGLFDSDTQDAYTKTDMRESVKHLLRPQPIPVEKDRDAPKFPGNTPGAAFYRGFGDYFQAYWGRNEFCEPYLMASALTQVGTVLGRRANISLSKGNTERFVIWPNFYNGIIGGTSIARKSTLLRQTQWDLTMADEECYFMESVSSAEGLIDHISKGDYETAVETDYHKCPEGIRTVLFFDEMRTLFANSRRQITSTIIPKLTEAYNCPKVLGNNTKHAPVRAHHPVLNILAASTGEWLEDSVTISDVAGGFINRFGFFLHEYVNPQPDPKDPKKEELEKWYASLLKLREHGDSMRQFVLSKEAWEIYAELYGEHYKEQWENQDDVKTAASARQMFHAFKIALAFAAVENDKKDNTVSADAFIYATHIAEYLSQVNGYLFEKVGAGEASKDEDAFLKALAKLGNETTRTTLRQKIGGKMMSRDRFNQVASTLEESGIIAIIEGRPQKIVRVEK